MVRIRTGSVLSLVVALLVYGSAEAQTRAGLIRDGIAADQAGFGEEVAYRLLAAGVRPDLGPPDADWRAGVRAIVTIHLRARRDSLAAVWLRWALRQDSTLNVPAQAMAASLFTAVRSSMGPRSPLDTLGRTSWVWPDDPVSTGDGRLRVTGPSLDVPVRLLAVGEGVLGGEETLPAGSYTIEASAAGYRTTRITREVLPGITTVLDIRLPREAVAQREAPQRVASTQRGGGFPWPLALLGIAAGGAVVVFAGGGGDGGPGPVTTPTTGGIIVSLPKR